MSTLTSATWSKPATTGFTLLEVLVSLLIIAVLAAFLSQILQSSLLSHQIMKVDINQAPMAQQAFHLQLAGESEEPVIELIPIEEETE
ncbi:type II secretion system protein [Kiritimatiellaeota bacterium B1221]|nr:type II secretion system protein [Kiritimatiellaeota bacterium B1221]